MKIYQLHEYGGEWEDRYDYIIGSYLRKERAEEEKVKAEKMEKEYTTQIVKLYDSYFTIDEVEVEE